MHIRKKASIVTFEAGRKDSQVSMFPIKYFLGCCTISILIKVAQRQFEFLFLPDNIVGVERAEDGDLNEEVSHLLSWNLSRSIRQFGLHDSGKSILEHKFGQLFVAIKFHVL